MDEQYFRDFILEEETRIQHFSEKIARGEIRPDRLASVERKIYSLKFGIWIAQYSAGADLCGLRDDFEELLYGFPGYWMETSSYVNMIWMASIAIMLDADKKHFSALAQLLDQYERHDALLDFLIDYKLTGAITLKNHNFTCPSPYGELGKVIENEGDRLPLLKSYLEKKWYSGHKKFGICDAHKAKEKIYSGYWSFESGALVNILHINDSSLKGTKYYPYDLAHFAGLTSR